MPDSPTRFAAALTITLLAIPTLLGCDGQPVATRAPGARPLDEELPGDTAAPGPTFRNLSVNLADGVHGSPPAGNQRLVDTVTIAFDYRPASGFENVIVQLDGKAVSTSGRINMVADHELAATADRKLPLHADDPARVLEARALLSTSDIPGEWSAHRASVDSLYRAVGVQEARERLSAVYTRAFDPTTDSTAMRALIQALGGQTYSASRVGPPPAFRGNASVSRAGSTLLLFVNGLIRWPTESAWVESDLRAIVASLGLPNVTTGHFYNDTPIRSPDFTVATCLAQAGSRGLVADPARTLTTGAGFLQWPVLFGACVPLVDLDTGKQALLNNLRFTPAVTDPGVTALAARIQQETAAGASVVLIAHSQGNLLVQQALGVLAASGPLTCVGVISLAAPRSAGWPVAGEEFGAVVVTGDIALEPGLNFFPVTDTDVAAAVRDLALLARTFVTIDVTELTERLFPHLMVESYLSGDASLAAVRTLIAAQVMTLQQRAACGGP
jgi:hypothetical protein